jgi:hypothetical protein
MAVATKSEWLSKACQTPRAELPVAAAVGCNSRQPIPVETNIWTGGVVVRSQRAGLTYHSGPDRLKMHKPGRENLNAASLADAGRGAEEKDRAARWTMLSSSRPLGKGGKEQMEASSAERRREPGRMSER